MYNTKNKIAVLVCGQLREFNIAVKSWNGLFDLNCDFYFSTWDKSSQSDFKWVNYLNPVTEVTKNMITDKIPNAHVSVLNEDKYNNINKYKITDKQILHWKNALKMCVDSGVKYDVIIVTRPDAFVQLPDLENHIDNLKECEIRNTGDENIPKFFEDILFMGKFNTMKIFIENINESKIFKIHEDIYRHITYLNFYLNPFPPKLMATEVRPITNELYRQNINYNNIKKSNEDFIIKYDKTIKKLW
jgi:hypothetical protein